jgi:antitoxin VapB
MAEERRAKLFMNGRSQAVRLPREFRFEGKEVVVRRVGKGVLLEAVPAPASGGDKVRAALKLMGAVNPEFAAMMERTAVKVDGE